MAWLVALFALLMVLDIVQTYFFPRFRFREGNPVLAKLMSQYGFDELFLAKYIVFFAVFVAAGQGWIGAPGLYGAIALQAAVLVWNAYKMVQGYRARKTLGA